jgi:hypothetical protein
LASILPERMARTTIFFLNGNKIMYVQKYSSLVLYVKAGYLGDVEPRMNTNKHELKDFIRVHWCALAVKTEKMIYA